MVTGISTAETGKKPGTRDLQIGLNPAKIKLDFALPLEYAQSSRGKGNFVHG